jgi:hypothetical protein
VIRRGRTTAPALVPTVGFVCSLCDVLHTHDAVNATLVVDDGALWLLALCPAWLETVRMRVRSDHQRAILALPVAVDPDVHDWVALKAQIDQIWTGVPL